MPLEFTTSYVKDATEVFRYYRKLAERSMEQLSDAGLYAIQDSESNSIAIIVKHVGGNLRSRWTDFLITDGEKPDRNRDSEFEEPPATRAELIVFWDSGWQRLLDTLESLTDDDLGRTIRIRGEAHSVMQAINRSLTHIAYHVGQITCIAKHLAASHWKPLTVPRGMSAEFNARVGEGKASQR
jgi:hypothetical protein